MRQEICFLAQFLLFIWNWIQTTKYLMHCFVLHHCSKFQTILITFRGFIFKKPSTSSLNGTFCWQENFWKMGTREVQVRYELNLHGICSTSTPFIYQKMRASRRNRYAWGGGAYKKPSKNNMKLTKFRLWHHLKTI